MFVPSWQHKIDGCSVYFWILVSNERLRPENVNQMDIFVSYPQILITTAANYSKISSLNLRLSKCLRFDQQVCLLGTKAADERLVSSLDDKTKLHYAISTAMGAKFIESIIQYTMKKNSKRCFEESLLINIYLLNALCEQGQES